MERPLEVAAVGGRHRDALGRARRPRARGEEDRLFGREHVRFAAHQALDPRPHVIVGRDGHPGAELGSRRHLVKPVLLRELRLAVRGEDAPEERFLRARRVAGGALELEGRGDALEGSGNLEA